MLKIGLTGGIASGKTAVANMLADLGAFVIDTDVIAHEVVEPGEPALKRVVDCFGKDILQSDGRLNRGKMRSLITADPEKRVQLESILHPIIRERTLQAMESAARQNAPYVVLVVPLLVETGFAQLADRVLVVDTDPSLQLQRLMLRDNTSEEDARRIIAMQAERNTRLLAADDVLENNHSLADLSAAVAGLHARYLQLAANLGAAKP